MAKQRLQTRVPQEIADEVEIYQEKHSMTQSEAIRHLLRVGLESEEIRWQPPSVFRQALTTALSIVTTVVFAFGGLLVTQALVTTVVPQAFVLVTLGILLVFAVLLSIVLSTELPERIDQRLTPDTITVIPDGETT